nr:hypothetical protein [Leptolyngbyaceae cyanobacterium MAG.088]
DLVEHMVEEGDASIGITFAGAIDVEGNGDVSFFGGTGDGGDTGGEFEILHDFWGVGAAPYGCPERE